MMDGFTPDLFDASDYPNRPGFKGTGSTRETSRAAAKAVAPRAPTMRARCLAEIVAAGSRGLTSDEVAGRLGHDKAACRPRMSELLRLGKIRDSGARRKTEMGAAAVVWLAVVEPV